jgi:enterochelin esterase-like enzyme
MNYRIYLPPCYGEENRTYPAIYLFHGSFHTDSHWDDLGIDETAEILISGGEIPPVLIIMQDGGEISQETSGGPSSFEGVILRELVPHIEQIFCVWSEPDGRAIGGLSRGGYWALEIAFRNPQHFQSVGGHSAALLDESAGSEYDPMVTAQSSDIDNLRIYLDAGRNDYVLPPLLELHEILLEADRDHHWILNEGRHEDKYWSAHLEDYLTWYTDPWPTDRALYPACSLESTDR